MIPLLVNFIVSIYSLFYFIFVEQEVKVCENDYYFSDKSTTLRIPRANVARFMLDILKNEKYIRQGIAVGLSKDG